MKKVICENGHFYDADRFGACPICGRCGGGRAEPARYGGRTPESEATLPLPQSSLVDELASSAWIPPAETQEPWEDDVPAEAPAPKAPDEYKPPEEASANPQVDEVAPTIWVPDSSAFARDGEPPEAGEADAEEEPGVLEPDEPETPAEEKPAAAPAALPVGWLVGLSGTVRGRMFPCKPGRNRIGSGVQMDISLPGEPSVDSETHAQIIYEPKKRQFFFQAGNGNGLSYRNNELVFTHEELHAYDRVALGEAEFVFLPLCGEAFDWE